MKRIHMNILAACLLGSVAFAANAQDAPPAEVDARAEVQAQVESDQEATEATHEKHDKHASAAADADAEIDHDCLKYTGSHISTSTLEKQDKDCVIAAGRVYTREDIENTGESSVAEALRKLDASIF